MTKIDMTTIRAHSDYTRSMAEFVLRHVQDCKSVIVATLHSLVFRDRLVKQSLLKCLSRDEQDMLRARFPDGTGILVDYLTALTMWKFKEEENWKDLHRIDAALAAHKPARICAKRKRFEPLQRLGRALARTPT